MNDPSHTWRHYYCGHCGFELDAPVSCGDRFCNVCGWGPRLRARDQITALIHHARVRNPQPLRFVTLTTLDIGDLTDGVRAIIQWFRKLRSSAWWRNRVSGGVYVVEATAQPIGWHVHLHAIVQSSYLPQHELSRRWNRISGAPIVYVQFVKKGDAPVSYLLKYLAKTAAPDTRRSEMTAALKSVRLFSRFGFWHDIDIKIPRRVCPCPHCHCNDWVLQREMCTDSRRWTAAFG